MADAGRACVSVAGKTFVEPKWASSEARARWVSLSGGNESVMTAQRRAKQVLFAHHMVALMRRSPRSRVTPICSVRSQVMTLSWRQVMTLSWRQHHRIVRATLPIQLWFVAAARGRVTAGACTHMYELPPIDRANLTFVARCKSEGCIF